MDLKNKKVLLIGLGILGGGLSMAEYLIKRDSILTITDLRTEKELELMVNKVKKIAKTNSQKVRFVLGENPISEITKADLIILNPAVSAFSSLVKEINKLGKDYYSDYTYFLKSIENRQSEARPKIIGVTGTRGKTTVSSWAHHFINNSVLGGNIPEAGLLKIQDIKTDVFVLELSSFQLEHATKKDRSPNIAIITNIYIDHLNRYKTLNRYSRMKKLIYANQTENDYLILNNDETTTKEIEADKPKSQICYISLSELPQRKNGLYVKNDIVYHKMGNSRKRVGKLDNFAPHEKNNFMFAALAANLYGASWETIFKKVKTLENPLFRQQEVYNKKSLRIINDSAGTSPDATMAAIEKFKSDNLYLITGGTNKELDYSELAKKIAKDVKPSQLYLLSGSGTNELINNFPKSLLHFNRVREYDSLEEIVKVVASEIKKGTIVFSPGGSSFEKFKNEFDRGNQFNKLVKKYFK